VGLDYHTHGRCLIYSSVSPGSVTHGAMVITLGALYVATAVLDAVYISELSRWGLCPHGVHSVEQFQEEILRQYHLHGTF
jgi:hypothetical protein